MNNKALTRYKLLDDVRGEVIGVTPRLVHDFCEGYEVVDADAAYREIGQLYYDMVDADDAAREIARLKVAAYMPGSEVTWEESSKMYAGDNKMLKEQVKRLEARYMEIIHDYERTIECLEGHASTLQARVRDIEEVLAAEKREVAHVEHERDRLRLQLGQREIDHMKELLVEHDKLVDYDRLREQYNKVLGAIDEGLVEDDATLAAASVTEMHAKIAQQ